MLTAEQAEMLAKFKPHGDFCEWDRDDAETVRWLLHEAGYIRGDVRIGENCFAITESGKKALNEYCADRADRADKKLEAKQNRNHDFVVATLSSLITFALTVLGQLLLRWFFG